MIAPGHVTDLSNYYQWIIAGFLVVLILRRLALSILTKNSTGRELINLAGDNEKGVSEKEEAETAHKTTFHRVMQKVDTMGRWLNLPVPYYIASTWTRFFLVSAIVGLNIALCLVSGSPPSSLHDSLT